jgi:hypothetical protein
MGQHLADVVQQAATPGELDVQVSSAAIIPASQATSLECS